MREPVLVIMAAGMGSRYGGLKQIDPVDEQGHIIMDFSLYDARLAGFRKVIFVIKRENEALFRERIGNRAEQEMEVSYVFQDLDRLPEGTKVPEGRVKPWGTGHAVLCAMEELDGPFCVINADDFYGRSAFALIYDYLTGHPDDELYRYAMVGYVLRNTVTPSGHVARGVCSLNARGELCGLTERTMIIQTPKGTAFSEDEGKSWRDLDPASLVSMNMWGFHQSFLGELDLRFADFLSRELPANPLKCEYFLPFVVDELLREGKAAVQVLPTPDKWYGVTYREDKETVVAAIRRMKEAGQYPDM